MNVSLTPELEKFIQEKVESQMYQTASEVVRAALRTMKEREEYLDWERREVQKGIDAADRGKLIPVTPRLLEDIKARGRKRLAALQRKKSA